MKTRHVYYSRTEDNPFLPREYIEQLKRDLDPKTALRQIYGQWVELDEERIYYEYNSDKQFLKNQDYEINKKYPVHLAFDFNIGEGKPMSSCSLQYINQSFHVFDQVVAQGFRTLDVCEEWFDKKYIFTNISKIIINGDASGKSKDTRSMSSDYDIIKKFFSQFNIQLEMRVPLANPPIRKRHNVVNAHCNNMNDETRLWIYKKASKVDEGLRLTALKKGAGLIEDDSKDYQHITTALGYSMVYETNNLKQDINYNQRIR